MLTKHYWIIGCVTAVLGLGFAACHFDVFDSWREDANGGPSVAAPDATPAPNARRMVGAFNAGKALEMQYGHYDPTTRRARWQPTHEELTRFGFNPSVKLAYTNVLLAEPFSDGQVEKYLVLTRTLPKPDACRGCVPVLGGAVFARDEDGWMPVIESRFIAHLESADKLSGRMVNFGARQPGALLHWRFTNNGFTEEGDVFIAIHGNNLQPVLSLITGGSNENDCDPSGAAGSLCWKYASKLTFQRDSRTAFEDLLMTTQGSRLSEAGELVTVNETRRYVFVNGRYVTQQAEDDKARRVRPRL